MVHPLLIPLLGKAYRAIEPLGHRPTFLLRQPFKPPVAGRLATMLCEGKHDTLRFTLSRLHSDSQRSSIEAMLDALDDSEGCDQWIKRLWQWYRQNREFHATTVLIHGLVKYAWIKRGGESGGKVREEQTQVFREALEEAERLLDKVLAIHPDNADFLCIRLITARGLGLDTNQQWARFRSLISVEPGHCRGHLLMLENLKKQWGGSDEALFKFARGRANQMPDGSSLKALVVHAHFEMRDQRRCTGDPSADDHFRQPEVAAEIESAWSNSLGSPLFRDESRSEELSNLFAAALYLAGRQDSARGAMAIMDGHCLAMPWSTMCCNIKEKANPGWVVDRVATELMCADGGEQGSAR
ncbi:MAG: hypothetical protein H6R13_1140 [Proteobacteria bacterium]|nr:hypothetical protein [Pseudomonadota bacterium]